ncbi:MAG TPA: hypothetical protein VGE65_02585 [Sphingobium sp.]
MAPFELKTDRQRSLLAVRLRGYWDMAMFDAYADAVRMELRRMKVQGGCRHCLVDATEFAVQSAEITKALQVLTDSFAPDCPERIAGISGSKLGELQARHAGASDTRRIFPTRKAAEAWLFAKTA